jgi:hypothetical protein
MNESAMKASGISSANRLPVSQVEARMKRECFLVLGKLLLPVKILNYRWEMGHHRFLVTPVGGRGEMWKNEEKLKFS